MTRSHLYTYALIGIILALHLPVLFAADTYLLTWFNTDDAYYYFVTARQIVAGRGITFDGIAPSNGFQPLWMLVVTPIFGLPGAILPLRVVCGLLIVLNIGTALLIFVLARRFLSGGVAFLTALAFSLLPPIHDVVTRGGMESGINAFFIAFLLYRLARTDTDRLRSVLLLSVAAVLAFLARLDNIFLAGTTGLWLVWRHWRAIAGPRSNRWAGSLKLATAYFSPLVLVLLVYMAWNQLAFGTPTPVSGQVKRWWGTLPNSVYGFPVRRPLNFIGQFVTDDVNIGPWSLLTRPYYRAAERLAEALTGSAATGTRRFALAALGLATSAAAGWLLAKRRRFAWRAVRGLGLIPLLGACLLQITYYKALGSVAERPWYWVAEMMALVLLGGLLLECVLRSLPRNRAMAGRRLGNSAYPLLLGLVMVAALVAPHIRRFERIRSPPESSFYLRRSAWLRANTEAEARIAMTGSGSTAYFTPDRVLVNLDGLINSYEYFQHLQAGTAASYLAEIGVDYIFGNTYIITQSDPYGGIFSGRLQQQAVFQDEDRNLVLWRFVPFSTRNR